MSIAFCIETPQTWLHTACCSLYYPVRRKAERYQSSQGHPLGCRPSSCCKHKAGLRCAATQQTRISGQSAQQLEQSEGVSGASEPSQSHGDSWQGETWGEPHSASSQSGAQLIQASASAPSVRFISREAGKFARPAAPFAVVAVVLCVAGATAASGWRKIVNTCKGCISCHGFGISRCTLCSGMGSVGWEGKWAHKEPCPLCLGHRFVGCSSCGGRFHRKMFSHNKSQKINPEDALAYVEERMQKLTD